MKTRHFRDLVVWQRAMMLARNVYTCTQTFPKEEVFGMTAQMRRAAVSIPSNIAEGHGRTTDKSFRLFLSQARGSLYELQTQLQLSGDLKYVSASSSKALISECEEIARMLNALLKVLKEKEEVSAG